jgi:GR25 family glycosyltransferase involved in LPS biosynthesis
VLDSIHTYNVSSQQAEELQQLEQAGNFVQKAVLDYTCALKKCYESQAPWVAMLEDDILLADGWFIRTLQGLYDIERKIKSHTNDWLFMRLFNQERSTGWASRSVGGNCELLISTCILVPTFVILSMLKQSSRSVRRNLDDPSVAIICLLVIPTFVVLFFQAGKASLLPPHPGVYDEPFGCCSQALVFPRHQVPRIKEYLLQRGSGQIDLMLDDLAQEDHLTRFALYPVQLQHIGKNIYCSLSWLC